ncbi:armadillo-type protein [Kockiozyma suomiensis]|uniref:armadillo-type protein n=1 Tax=Kockiozyma suomiensis TaxID=1337062 RepID=UPI0033439B5B
MDNAALNHIFTDLRSKSPEVRNRAADELRDHLSTVVRELPIDQFTRYSNDVNRRIFELIHSTDTNDKFGGIAAIDRLIDFDGTEENATKISRFANYLRIVIPSNDVEAMRVAAKALGRLAIPGGTLTLDFVEFEVKRALEWLQSDRQESRRQAAMLIITELAANSPTILYAYVPQILDVIWVALRDPKVAVRIDAADALRACLKIMYQRDNQMRQQWYERIYTEAQLGFTKIGSADAIHGSLLVYRELFEQAGMFMHKNYANVCDTVLKYKDHRDSLVRRTVLAMMPTLASYNPTAFADKYMHPCMLHLLGQLKKDRERNQVFQSIGQIAGAVHSSMGPYLDAILTNIKEGLSQKGRARKEQEKAIFECISMLAAAVGQALTKNLNLDILDLMFACGLSEHLRATLVDLAKYIKPLLPTLQERLITIISISLSGRPFRVPGSPESNLPMLPEAAREYRESMISKDGPAGSNDIKDSDLIALSMRILGTFDFSGYTFNEFVRNCVILYLDDENPEVRKAAALASCSLFLKDPICFQTSAHAIRVVGDVLEKLLSVAISDPVADIRLEVLSSFDARFDSHLSQADNVRLLFTALNDEVFAVRQVAISIIGRLTNINPAYVMPPLRKTLIQLLTELEYSTSSRSKEASAKLLSILVRSTKGLIKPYVNPMIKVLLPKASDSSTATAASVISALGELARVGGEDLIPYIPDLMPLILDVLQDQSSPVKRDAALRTLGQLASSSGYVIDPLIDYPQLLGVLVSILRSEQSSTIQCETVKLIGILGALDPYRHQMVERGGLGKRAGEQDVTSSDVSTIMFNLTAQTPPSGTDEYYASVVIKILLTILRDPSLGTHHTAVVQAIMYIFKTLGVKCVPFLGEIIPVFLQVMRTCSHSILDFYFQQLGIMVTIVRQHIRNFLPDIFSLVNEFFNKSPGLQITILSLVESVSRAMEGDFKMYMQQLLPLMLPIIDTDRSAMRTSTQKVLHAFVVFGSNVEEYIHLLLPSVVRLFENAPPVLEIAAMETVGQMCKNVNMADMVSRIMHPTLRVLGTTGNEDVRKAAIELITSLIYYLRDDTTVFIPVINKVVVANKIYHAQYELLVNRMIKKEPFPQKLDTDSDRKYAVSGIDEVSEAKPPSKKLPVNQEHLKAAWEASQKSTRDDWQEWVRRLSVELLKESPSHALRACASLAGVYYPLAKDLFNVSFVSCWAELYEQNQDELVRSIETALMSPKIPPEILQTLLNLAEFMEHDDKALPMDIRTLGQFATRCHAYAKALHYKELEFIQEPTTPTIEALISINNQLQQNDAAVGILKHAQLHNDLQLKETWYEKLQRWEDALEAYNRREKDEPDSLDITMGRMRCLHALGEWDLLSQLAHEKWTNSPTDIRRSIAPLAAAAAWGLGQWDRMDTYISVMKTESPDRSFFRAILSLHRNNFDDATTHIGKARDLLITELSALVSESYNRAYGVVVRVQMLSELEEIITYKMAVDDPDQQRVLRKTWSRRLRGCQRNVDIWQRMLKVRALVVKPRQDMEMWIKFANLCRKSGRMGLAEKSLNSLVDDPHPSDAVNLSSASYAGRAPPQVVYAQLKYMWAAGKQLDALNHLCDFTAKMSQNLGLNTTELMLNPLPAELRISASAVNLNSNLAFVNGNGQQQQQQSINGALLTNGHSQPPSAATLAASQASNGITSANAKKRIEDYTKLLARCFLKQGEWQIALQPQWHNENSHAILRSYLLATYFDKGWYKAWHNWALANFEVVTAYDKADSKDRNGTVLGEVVEKYVLPAIQGFFKSIYLSSGNSLQDTLRLLTLWFRYGGLPEPAKAMNEGFTTVSIDTWLEVIPQLIARIHQPNMVVRKSLHSLISDLGRTHPQSLVYPLTVAIKSDSVTRQKAAMAIMDKMRAHSATLVKQAEIVIQELIRVAVLWHEQWHEGLEDASRLFFGDHNIEKMFATLEPLHKMLEMGPQTLREISFHQAFGRDLREAYEWVLSFKRTNDMTHLNQAWDVYYNVFRRITRQLPQLNTLDLQYVSPNLLECNDLELAMPGTYESGKPIIRIMHFDPTFTVITSKQRPRKLSIRGSDGVDYQYLLKGHEDIRQDSLVMQLFGLVNTLLGADSECFKRHLSIQQYPAIPLSPKSGLLGWVKNSDTFHVLIREYRDNRKILLNIEHRIMLQMAPDYDHLTLIQKVEVFMYALDNTTGQDLYRVLWLKSRSSEAWLDRRTTYTRSLAVMSMVGYILGLGDRHPSNLMMDRNTGKVVHIDFGDCFEAAILREKYPEKVPFRLTRMLTYAMEVSGIEGSFRITCENVMRVLRDNKESLMAILEAFAHDPLINWGFNLPQPERPSQGAMAQSQGLSTQQPQAQQQSYTAGASMGADKGRTAAAAAMMGANTLAASIGKDRRSSMIVSPSSGLDKRRPQIDEEEVVNLELQNNLDSRNQRATVVLKRISDKLTGNDFKHPKELDVPHQVDKLIQQATSVENLCQHFIGWCSFW